MKKTILSLATLAILATPLSAGEKVKVDQLPVKTLPTAVYAQLAKGSKLSLEFKSPDFDASKGYHIGAATWKASEHIGDAMDYFKSQAKNMGSTSGAYTLDLTVTEAAPGKLGFAFGNDYGFIVLAGVVKQGSKVVACFVSKEKGDFGGGLTGGISQRPAVDKLMSAIDGDLFRQ